MHVSTTQVLRKFAQKMAAQNKQANPLTALADPSVLGGLGGAAVGGLGAYGLARLTQSEEDKEKSNMPMIAGLLGALAGGAGGAYGAPHLMYQLNRTPFSAKSLSAHNAAQKAMEENFAKTVKPQPEIVNTADGPRDLQVNPQVDWKHQPNRGATEPVVPNAESQQYLDDIASGGGNGPSAFTPDGQPDKAQLSAMGLGSR
jgi:hypothetical protein